MTMTVDERARKMFEYINPGYDYDRLQKYERVSWLGLAELVGVWIEDEVDIAIGNYKSSHYKKG